MKQPSLLLLRLIFTLNLKVGLKLSETGVCTPETLSGRAVPALTAFSDCSNPSGGLVIVWL